MPAPTTRTSTSGADGPGLGSVRWFGGGFGGRHGTAAAGVGRRLWPTGAAGVRPGQSGTDCTDRLVYISHALREGKGPNGGRGPEVVGTPGALRGGAPGPRSARSATSTRTSTRWRPSCCGRGPGRWRAGWRRSRGRTISPSTRSSTSRSSWCAPRTGEWPPSRTPAGIAASRSREGRGTCESGFICPFHGWCYGPDGRNTFVPRKKTFAEHNLVPEDLDLTPVRCEVWGGCAWINLDDDAPAAAPVHRAVRHRPRRLEGRVDAGRVVVRLPPPGQLEARRRGVHGAVPRGGGTPPARHPRHEVCTGPGRGRHPCGDRRGDPATCAP